MAQSRELQTIIRLLGRVDPSLRDSIGDVDTRFGKLMKTAGRVGAGIATGMLAATAAVTTFAVDSVKKFAEFEESINKVATIADPKVMNIDQLQEGVLELSSNIGVAAEEIAEAQYQYISATGDTLNSIANVETAAKLARGGFTQTATAIDGVTSSMNAWGLSGEEEFKRIADMMIVTQNLGKTTAGEISGGIGAIASIASAAGMSIEEVNAATVVMTGSGIATSEAFTAMKATLSNIIKPSTDAADAAISLGIDLSAAALESKGFSRWMKDVKSSLESAEPAYAAALDKNASLRGEIERLIGKTDKLSKSSLKGLQKELKQSDAELETLANASGSTIGGFSEIFGSVEALNGMLAITSDDGMAKFDNAMLAMQNSSGSTQTAFNQMQQGIGARWELFTNKITNMQIQLGSKLADPFMKLADTLFPIIEDVLPGLFDALVPIVEAVLPALGSVLSAIIPSIAEFMKAVAPMLTKFIEAITPLLDPIVSVVTVLLNTLILPLIGAFTTFIELIMPALEAGLNILAGVFEVVATVVGKVAGLFESLFGWLMKVGEGLDDWSQKQGAASGSWAEQARVDKAEGKHVVGGYSGSGNRVYADGGIAYSASVFGEAGAEMAIPLTPSKRGRATELLQKTQAILGAQGGGNATNIVININSNQDPSAIAELVYNKLQTALASDKRREQNSYA